MHFHSRDKHNEKPHAKILPYELFTRPPALKHTGATGACSLVTVTTQLSNCLLWLHQLPLKANVDGRQLLAVVTVARLGGFLPK